ncbi:hypothetical protein ACJX09_09120 [Enterobacter asburiae]|uniref:hypothetical protein n=1 Tax=Enterobacter asburiae TaxID=61645 RepID=UPI003D7CE5FA
MNEFVLDAKNTLEKISSFKCASFKKLSDGSLIFQLDFEGDQFFGMFKHFLDEYLLINITNPITYIDDEEAIVNFEIANDFNKKAIGVKGVIADLEKKQVMFSREGANKQVISSQADSLIKISRIWADFFPANTSNQPI